MTVRYEAEGNVAVITIDRPEVRNAVDDATAGALLATWQRFKGDEQALVGVLTGSGNSFCSGADLKKLDNSDRDEGYLGFSRFEVGKPTIAAVEGHCVAGGLELALWCDLRIASTSAVFGCFERRYGVPLVDGGTQRLPRVVGLGRAMDMILTGRPVDAEEALAIGLVNRVVPEGAALVAAVQMARAIAQFPQETVRSDRRAVHLGMGRDLDEGLQIERDLGNQVLDVAVRGAQRFTEGHGRHGRAVDA